MLLKERVFMENLLLPILKREQKKLGYLSEDALKKISKDTSIPISRVYGAASFYTMLETKPKGKHIIRICNSPSCNVNGSLNIIKFLEEELDVVLNNTTKDGKFSIFEASCIGCCDKAPAMMLDGKPYTNLTEKKIRDILTKCKS